MTKLSLKQAIFCAAALLAAFARTQAQQPACTFAAPRTLLSAGHVIDVHTHLMGTTDFELPMTPGVIYKDEANPQATHKLVPVVGGFDNSFAAKNGAGF